MMVRRQLHTLIDHCIDKLEVIYPTKLFLFVTDYKFLFGREKTWILRRSASKAGFQLYCEVIVSAN